MASLTNQERAAADLSHSSDVERLPSIDKRTSFDGVTLTFHWATVVLVLGLFTTAIWHAQSHDDVLKVLLLRIHRSLGVTVWMTTVLRLVWRKTNAKLPPFPDDMTQLHRALVQISEYCLYALLVIQPTIGFSAMLTRGRSFTLFWGHVPPLIPHYPTVEAVLFSLHRARCMGFGSSDHRPRRERTCSSLYYSRQYACANGASRRNPARHARTFARVRDSQTSFGR